MKLNVHRQKLKGVITAIALLGTGMSGFAQAPMVSQFSGVTNSVVDEFGHVLKGTDPGSGDYQVTPVVGDRVEVLLASDGTIYPPDLDGYPDPRNPTLFETRIGLGVSPALSRSGQFSTQITPRPAGEAKIFVRVFNATSGQQANFYADCLSHPNMLRMVALSGGYPRAEANRRLAENNGMIASFSRALTEGLSAQQTELEFNKMLDESIETIYQASCT